MNSIGMKKRFRIIYSLTFLLLLISCSVFKKKGTITGIKIIYDNSQSINYGKKVNYKVIANYSSGKSKNIVGKKETTIKVYGASNKKDYFFTPKYPTELKDDKVYISATYTLNDKVYKDSIAIPFNYKGTVLLEFNGQDGVNGSKGKGGKKSMVFRDGKDGEAGTNGGNAKNGHNIQVYIWKEQNMYIIKVVDMDVNKSYFYKANQNTEKYYFYVKGGNGGNGGNGGDGGNGKDAVVTEKKTKAAGNGGNGAKGGNGGNGGTGGNAYVFIHPNAVEFKNKIVIYNDGGKGGKAGTGGKAGKAGKVLEGQTPKIDGKAGVPGIAGFDGVNGEVISIEIMEFDINDIKQNN